MPRITDECQDGKQRANELKVDAEEGSNIWKTWRNSLVAWIVYVSYVYVTKGRVVPSSCYLPWVIVVCTFRATWTLTIAVGTMFAHWKTTTCILPSSRVRVIETAKGNPY
jgi:hypothetical protein